MRILVLNCGSSTVKYKFFNMKDNLLLAGGLADRIGSSDSSLAHAAAGRKEHVCREVLTTHDQAVEKILRLLTGERGVINHVSEIHAVGHRVVHGGCYFRESVAVDNEVLKLLEKCSPLAPLHNPPNLSGINACRKLMPAAVQVAVLDTAYHQTIPDYAFMYALPHNMYHDHSIRKYGFHGISHSYVAARSASMLNVMLESLRIITCHLGNGASLCAIGGGRSLDTTMGFTPLAGLIMGTRCGDIDPAIIPFLMEKEGVSLAEAMNILNRKSGVLGVSGVSADFRDLEGAALAGHQGSRLALDMFSYSASRGVGSLVSTIGGLDVLVFTAGVGENSPDIRQRICSRLNYLGVSLDEERNSVKGKELEISSPDSAVRVLVIPTDEERAIAEETRQVAEKIIHRKGS